MRNKETERITAKSKADLDAEAGEALLGDDGLLGSSTRMSNGLNDFAAGAFLQLVEPDTDTSRKLKDKKDTKKDKEKEPQEMKPPTLKEEMVACAARILKDCKHVRRELEIVQT